MLKGKAQELLSPGPLSVSLSMGPPHVNLHEACMTSYMTASATQMRECFHLVCGHLHATLLSWEGYNKDRVSRELC